MTRPFFIPEDRPGVVRNDYPLGQAPLVPQVTEFILFFKAVERGVLVSAATAPDFVTTVLGNKKKLLYHCF